MNSKLKKLIGLSLVALVGVGLTACGKSQDQKGCRPKDLDGGHVGNPVPDFLPRPQNQEVDRLRHRGHPRRCQGAPQEGGL